MSDDLDARALARVGSVLNDKWTLDRLVGVGGMAAVYAGIHRNGAKAAVKVLHPHLGRIPEVRERFLREGKAANRVDHPGVVKVLDDDIIREGADEGAAYLVMELLEGESLEDRLERAEPITELDVLQILRQVLEVLRAAHDAGVVHRDLKPENLLLLNEGGVKVLDFGLARIQDGNIRTVAGLALGTPSYMPPEQAGGHVELIDGRADIFALGATAFRILANRTIHPGTNAVEIALKMSSEPAPKLRQVAPYVSESLASIVDRACAFKLEDRYQNAGDMLADVERAIAALGAASTAKTAEISLSDVMSEVKAPPPPLPRPPPEKRTTTSSILDSIHIPGLPRRRARRGSLLPLVTVVVLAGVAIQVTLDVLNERTEAPLADAAPQAIEASVEAEAADAVTTTAAPVEASIDDAGEPDAGPAEDEDAAAEDGGEDANGAAVHDAAPAHVTAPRDAGKKDAGHPAIKPTAKPTAKPTGTKHK